MKYVSTVMGKIIGLTVGILAALLLALPSLPAFALSTQLPLQLNATTFSNAAVSAGSVFMESTIAVALVFIMAMAFSLQIARGYFTRILNKFTLRLGADIWWLAYVLIRDGLIFISFIMGLLVFLPGTFQDYPIAVPFMPLSVVLFGLALITKLYFDADDNRNIFRAVTILIFGGALLWIFGTVFITETPLSLAILPSGISTSSGMWYNIYNTFSSTANVNLSMTSFYVCFAALGILGVFGLAHPILHSRLPKLKKAMSPPMTTTAASLAPVARISRSQQGTQEPSSRDAVQDLPDSVQTKAREKIDYIR